MQVFMPYESITDSLNCLDDRRLGKQRVEARQILDIIENNYQNYSGAWKNHPAVLMYVNYAGWLRRYYNWSLRIWSDRGFKNIKLRHDNKITYILKKVDDTYFMPDKNYSLLDLSNMTVINKIMSYNTDNYMMLVDNETPPWIGDEEFHKSHQSNLVRKKPCHYRLHFPNIENNLPYYWPINKRNFKYQTRML